MSSCHSNPVYGSDTVQLAMDYLIENMQYKCGSVLGKGTYGSVVKVVNPKGVSLAAKVVEKRLLNNMEIIVWPKLQHPNVLKLIEAIEDQKGNIVFITPLMSTSLFSRLQSSEFKKDPKALERCRTYSRQVLNGVAYLHRLRLCHLDLRAENIFLSLDDDRAVVGDFSGLGWADADRRFCPLPTSLRPPELITKKKKGFAPEPVDLWSCGLLISNLFLGKGFYYCTIKHAKAGQLEAVQQYTALFQCEEYVKRFIAETYSACSLSQKCVKNLVSIIGRFLQANPKHRLKTEDALSHPFFINHPVRKRPGKFKVKLSRAVSSLLQDKSDESLKTANRSQSFEVTITEESPKKVEPPLVVVSAVVKGTKASRWSRYKQRISQMTLPFRTVPFLKTIKFNREEKKKPKKPIKANT